MKKSLSFHKKGSQGFLVQTKKRKFLMSAVGLLGVLPIMKVFKWGKSKTPYIVIISMKSAYANFMAEYRKGFAALNTKKFHQKKLLKFHSYISEGRIFFLYVFSNKSSRWEWGEQINNQTGFFSQKMPTDAQYHKSEGFFNKDSLIV